MWESFWKVRIQLKKLVYETTLLQVVWSYHTILFTWVILQWSIYSLTWENLSVPVFVNLEVTKVSFWHRKQMFIVLCVLYSSKVTFLKSVYFAIFFGNIKNFTVCNVFIMPLLKFESNKAFPMIYNTHAIFFFLPLLRLIHKSSNIRTLFWHPSTVRTKIKTFLPCSQMKEKWAFILLRNFFWKQFLLLLIRNIFSK